MRFCKPLIVGFAVSALLLPVTFISADEKPKSASGGSKARSSSGDAYVLGQLRLLFDSWDSNRDGYVDRSELAKAFRGAGARPYTGTESAIKVQSRYPDQAFMVQVDQNKDGKISLAEFEDWARGYLKEQRKLHAAERRVAQMERKLARTADATERKDLAMALEAEKRTLAEQKKEMHTIDLVEKHLSRRKIR